MKSIYFIFIILTIFSISCASKFTKIQKSKDIEYKLKMADHYYIKKKFEQAQLLYEDCFPFLKGKPKYEDYYFKFANSYYLDKDYLNAENIFKNLLTSFPESKYAIEVEFLHALCFYKQSPKPELDQTDTYKSIANLQTYIYKYPNSIYTDSANKLLEICKAKLETKDILSAFVYYNLGFFKSASIAFNEVNLQYPDSKKSDYSKYYMLLSSYKYALKSLPEFQMERYNKVVEECYDFEQRYFDSPYLNEILEIKKAAMNEVKNNF